MARRPPGEERQVLGEAHLGHAETDGALDVLACVALGVGAHARVDVIVGDHAAASWRQAYTSGPPRGAAARPRRQDEAQAHAGHEAPDMGEERHAHVGVAERQYALHGLEHEPDPEQDPGRHRDHREDETQREHAQDSGVRIQHEIGAEHAGDGAAGADQRGRGPGSVSTWVAVATRPQAR